MEKGDELPESKNLSSSLEQKKTPYIMLFVHELKFFPLLKAQRGNRPPLRSSKNPIECVLSAPVVSYPL